MDTETQSKEIEKPFRCNVCSLGFTNEDHLQVHKKRHEMSLNLSKLNVGGGGGSGIEGFTDETPTPTRFIKNCEEVGLFQDLQNVNPFDEQFVKAASSTPSSENGFDFSFNFRQNSLASNSGAVQTTSNETTLNTPQVFVPITPSTVQCQKFTLLPRKDTSASEIENTIANLKIKKKDTVSQNEIAILGLPQEKVGSSSTESQQTNITSRLIISTKNKANLRLKLSPDISSKDDSNRSDINELHSVIQLNSEQTIDNSTDGDGNEKKACILERNRAAASRSRERRKQYISALEMKCATLQAKLGQIQSELVKAKTENLILKEQLDQHSNCNVTIKNNLKSSSISSTVATNTVIFSHPKIEQTSFKPSILRHNSQKLSSPTKNSNVVMQPEQMESLVTISTPVITSTYTIHLDPAVVSTKPKRGRPRRGFEKRVSDLSFIPIPKLTSCEEPPKKIQILPIRTAIQNSNNTFIKTNRNAIPIPNSEK